MEDIWVEKYRPRSLDEVAGQNEIVRRLKAYVQAGNLPNLLFAGPPGTGKTTCAIAVARELYGESWRDFFKELNASDERGIDVVRENIKYYARTSPMGDVPFKILFLDEADALTADAQAALRRTMERYSSNCRFILSANYSSKIIEPIQSRCAVFRFRPLKGEDIRQYLVRIAGEENLEVTEDGYDALVYIAQGDMRKAVNALQVAASVSKKIDSEVLYQTTSTAHPEEVRSLLEAAMKGEFLTARKVLDEMLIKYGLSGEDVIRQLHGAAVSMATSDDWFKLQIIDRIGEAEFRIMEGSNERIQLEWLLAQIALLGERYR